MSVQAWIFLLFGIGLGSWFLSTKAKGSIWDRNLTFGILVVSAVSLIIGWWFLIDLIGLSLENPIVIMTFAYLVFFFGLLAISRFVRLNVVKVFAWFLGLSVIFLALMTVSIWGTIEACSVAVSSGVRDPLWLTIGIFLAWTVVAGSLFSAGVARRWSKLWSACVCVGVGLSVWLAGYTSNRCPPPTDPDQLDGEPGWVGSTIWILNILSYLNLIIGQFYAGGWFAFLAYFILDTCAPPSDTRKMVATFALAVLFPIALLFNAFSGVKSAA